MTIRDLPPDARPREKLLAAGPAALADAELLALLLRTGVRGMGVLQLAQHLLDEFGGLHGLLKASAHDLKRIKGLGPAKRSEVCAVLEIARRSMSRQLSEQPVFEAPQHVEGQEDELIGRIQKRTGETREAIEDALADPDRV